MPKDKVAKESASKKPQINFTKSFLTAAASGQMDTSLGMNPKLTKKAEQIRGLIQAAADRRERLSESKTGRKILAQESKAEKDKNAKRDRREVADQLGLGRDAQKEPKGANKEKMQKENTAALMEKLNKMPKGSKSRTKARQMLDAIKNGPVIGISEDLKNVRVKGASNTYLGDGVSQVTARLKELAGKSYSGKKENTGVYANKKEKPNVINFGRAKREYVKARRDVDVTKSKRSKLTEVKKNPVGRPKGSKNKPKNPPTA